jgi:ABC-type antimicrobial peptide transport system permease subunit
MCIVIRTAGDPRAVAEPVRRVLADMEPLLPVLRVDTVEEQLGDALAGERALATLSLGFGSFAALLACIGLYAVVANAVLRRTNEIGIRMALGAPRSAVVRMVLRDTGRIVVGGLVVGAPLAVVAESSIRSRLYGVGANDLTTIAIAVVTLLAVAAVAGLLPARRAARIDPNSALRYD